MSLLRQTQLVVVHVGAASAYAPCARETAFLHRTGHPPITESTLLHPKTGEPFAMAILPTIDARVFGAERAARLAELAVNDALAPVIVELQGARVLVQLVVEPDAAARDSSIAASAAMWVSVLTHTISSALGEKSEVRVEVVARGPAGAAFALDRAQEALNRNEVDAVFLGGTHTDHDPARIEALGDAGRIVTADMRDGIIPGEGSAFAVVMRSDVARARGLAWSIELTSWGTGLEKARADNDEPAYHALGLTMAMHEAIKPVGSEKLGWMVTDLAFENFRLFEWQAMYTRTSESWCSPQMIESPSQRAGNLGCATLPFALMLASEAHSRGYAPHELVGCIAGSDDGARGVIIARRSGRQGAAMRQERRVLPETER